MSYSFYNKYTQRVALEQNLYQNLTDEQINLYGADIYYLPRERVEDSALSDITFSNFNVTIQIKALLQNNTKFEAEQEFITEYDVEIKDELRFLISTRQWKNTVLQYSEEYDIIETNEDRTELKGKYRRPIEGDLIWFPLTNDLYEIKYTQQESKFYQFGEIQFYELKAQIYSNVGNEEIDVEELPDFEDNLDVDSDGIEDTDEINTINEKISPSITIRIEPISGNPSFPTSGTVYVKTSRRVGSRVEDNAVQATGIISSYDSGSRTLKLVDVKGEFTKNKVIYYDDDSSTGWRVKSDHLTTKDESNESNNNAEFNEQSDVDFTENNPYGQFNSLVFND